MKLNNVSLEDDRCHEAFRKIFDGDTAKNENWRYVATPKFTSYEYIVSDQGRVVSLPRYRYYGANKKSNVKHRKFLPGGIMKPGIQPSGHQTITLIHQKKPFRTHVHRLVAWAFLGPQPSLHSVRHLDGNPRNNHLTNLAYGMPWENIEETVTPTGFTEASIVIEDALMHRIKAAVQGQVDATAVLSEILEMVEDSRRDSVSDLPS
ncbi:MAG: HNH endonuclease [Rhodothermales bacterium]